MSMRDKLESWEGQMRSYSLPRWEQLPELDLYMDQVVLLLGRYLNFPTRAEDEEKIITPSIVNNYVRMKIMPAPVKKKYSRVHIAYLIVICTLKQGLSISSIQKMIPMDLKEEEIAGIYNGFVDCYNSVVSLFSKYTSMMLTENSSDEAISTIAAVVTNLSKSLTEHLLSDIKLPQEEKKEEKAEKKAEKKAAKKAEKKAEKKK